jgi:hypothetical protein
MIQAHRIVPPWLKAWLCLPIALGCGSIVDTSPDAGGLGPGSDATSGSDDGGEFDGPDADTSVAPELELLFPARTWPGNPVDLHVEVLGSGFASTTRLIWDVGGDEVEVIPITVEEGRLEVTLDAELWEGRTGAIAVALQHGGLRSESFDFALGGVLPDTGQGACFSNNDELLDCPEPGERFDGQDAQHGWDLHVDRSTRFGRAGSTNQFIVVDAITELQWQGCVAGKLGPECETGTEERHAWDEAEAYCAGLDWGGVGAGQWRLPSAKELATLVHRGSGAEPTVYAESFPGTPTGERWTSSIRAEDPDQAWVGFGFGIGVVAPVDKTQELTVRCVRGAPLPEPRLHRSEPDPGEHPGQWVVRDLVSGLMWQACSAGQAGSDCQGEAEVMSWEDALGYCGGVGWGGYDDWRLPDVNELQGLLDYTLQPPSVDTGFFPGTPLGQYYSSSSVPPLAGAAWRVAVDGSVPTPILPGGGVVVTKAEEFLARCVRGGSVR